MHRCSAEIRHVIDSTSASVTLALTLAFTLLPLPGSPVAGSQEKLTPTAHVEGTRVTYPARQGRLA